MSEEERTRPKSVEEVRFAIDTAPEIVQVSLRMGAALVGFVSDEYLEPLGEGLSLKQRAALASTFSSMLDYDSAMFLYEGGFIAPEVLELIAEWHKKRAQAKRRSGK